MKIRKILASKMIVLISAAGFLPACGKVQKSPKSLTDSSAAYMLSQVVSPEQAKVDENFNQSVSSLLGTEGHGGDPLRLLFTEARAYAVDQVQKIKECAFDLSTRKEVKEWILSRQTALADDIQESPHVWIDNGQSTCAHTLLHGKADIKFSFEACRPGVHGIKDAMEVLVHESVHHLGEESEEFSDEVALAISKLGKDSICPAQPSSQIFDPASCPGNPLSEEGLMDLIGLPESPRKELGKVNWAIRSRICYTDNWCSQWLEEPKVPDHSMRRTALVSHRYYEDVLWHTGNTSEGKLYAALVGNKPRIYQRWPDNQSPSAGYAVSSAEISNYNLQGFYGVGTFRSTNENWWAWQSSVFPVEFYVHSPARERTDWSENEIISRSDRNDIRISGRELSPKGWVTRTCMRQELSYKIPRQDNQRNQISEEYNFAILSHFD